jgi:hypothetical protein
LESRLERPARPAFQINSRRIMNTPAHTTKCKTG